MSDNLSFDREVVRCRTRSDLHIKKLQDFEMYCREQGWYSCPTKGAHEVLRMRLGSEWLIVHKRDSATQHLTVWGNSAEMLRKWFKGKKSKTYAELQSDLELGTLSHDPHPRISSPATGVTQELDASSVARKD
jgi:hypothetical protein